MNRSSTNTNPLLVWESSDILSKKLKNLKLRKMEEIQLKELIDRIIREKSEFDKIAQSQNNGLLTME